MKVETTYGYIKDSEGHIISKCELPKGKHSLKNGYVYVEVATKADLNKIQVHILPLSPEKIRENKIKKEMNRILRDQAIKSLKEKGEIE